MVLRDLGRGGILGGNLKVLSWVEQKIKLSTEFGGGRLGQVFHDMPSGAIDGKEAASRGCESYEYNRWEFLHQGTYPWTVP